MIEYVMHYKLATGVKARKVYHDRESAYLAAESGLYPGAWVETLGE